MSEALNPTLDPNEMVEALRKTTELQPAPPDPDEAEVDYDHQFNVEIVVIPWRGAWLTEPENATILVTRNVKINGHLMKFESDPMPKEIVEGEQISVDQGEAKIAVEPFVMIYLRRLTKESFDALEVDENIWMEETTKETLVLPVASLTVRVVGEDYNSEPDSFR